MSFWEENPPIYYTVYVHIYINLKLQTPISLTLSLHLPYFQTWSTSLMFATFFF